MNKNDIFIFYEFRTFSGLSVEKNFCERKIKR